MELNYIYVLAGVAILWRPSPNAKEYAYVMELPAMTAGEDEDGNELELTGVVPSAVDDDDEEEEEEGQHVGCISNGFEDEPEEDTIKA
jgi:hypothetical protein